MTFSIIAHDPRAGELGAAIASFGFGIGTLSLWARAGAGIVVTQMIPDPKYGSVGLDRMEAGERADVVLPALLDSDAGAGVRQVAMLDSRGVVAAYTGSQCVAYAGHRAESGTSAQGAILRNPGVWDRVYQAFQSAEGSLAARLICALEEGQSQGGDLRGHRVAAVIVVRAVASDQPLSKRIVDLRVDDHPEPISEIRRLYSLHELYSASNAAFEAAQSGEMVNALKEFERLEMQTPADPDIALRHGILLALSGDVVNARRRFAATYAISDTWREMVRRLASAGFIPEDPRLV